MTDLTGMVEIRAFDVLWRLLGLTSNTPDWCAIRDWVMASTTQPTPLSLRPAPPATPSAEVQRLREYCYRARDFIFNQGVRTNTDLEWLNDEWDALREAADLQRQLEATQAELREAHDGYYGLQESLERAEAEVQRLREALEQIADEQVNPRITAIALAAIASAIGEAVT